MLPEQARGKPGVRRTGVWAFGCDRNAMLSGPKQQHPVDAGKRRRVWNPALPVHLVTTVSRG